ncbi:MAG: methionyl-tRNA synthetase [Thelocarpon superellum]|nr:MAG: methionyl-tRNA synthetase [Thelocarpon superellum]
MPSTKGFIAWEASQLDRTPHVGHLYSMVLADIIKRWQELKGSRAILSTGTDEHGMKVQQAAVKAGLDSRPFCDQGAKLFKTLAERAHISNDLFVRTTDPDHKEAVEYAWAVLQERGYIYPSKHEGWYSVSDETFYPKSAVHLILDPRTGRKMMTSIETGKEVEWTSESNYHFRLSALKDRLLNFYAHNPNFVVPATRMNDVIRTVSSGLDDLSISRPVERLSWGIRVPGDDSQTIYVWLDALVNYITKAGYPWTPGQESTKGWPADCQVVGKDIIRFHCIYWPAFLLALDLPPPRQILTHAHWTLGHQKMAKSTGNVVNPFFAIDRFEVDTMRYYLAHDGGISDDADYGNEFIIERYKVDLHRGLGGLSSRILRSKKWNVREAILAGTNGDLPSDMPASAAHRQALSSLAERVDRKFQELDPGAALKLIIEMIPETNKYLGQMQPWKIGAQAEAGDDARARASTKQKQKQLQLQLHQTIYLATETLRIVAILLQPYMPTKAAELLAMLGVDDAARSFEFTRLGADANYGIPRVQLGRGLEGVLFPPPRSLE